MVFWKKQNGKTDSFYSPFKKKYLYLYHYQHEEKQSKITVSFNFKCLSYFKNISLKFPIYLNDMAILFTYFAFLSRI